MSKNIKAAIVSEIKKAAKEFKANGIKMKRLPSVACFLPGGQMPKSRAEAKKRQEFLRAEFGKELANVIKWFEERGGRRNALEATASPEDIFSGMRYEADVNEVEEEDCGSRTNDDAEAGVSFPIFSPGGRTKAKNPRDKWCFQTVRYFKGSWRADCVGGMIAADSLYDAAVFAFVSSIINENGDFDSFVR